MQMASSSTATTPSSKSRKREATENSSGASERPSLPWQTNSSVFHSSPKIVAAPAPKKARTIRAWTEAEEKLLSSLKDQGKSWPAITKNFPTRTVEGVKKHWQRDMHYAEFDQQEASALREAIKEYDAAKWKTIGVKLNKPAKACEQYAKQHFTKDNNIKWM